MYEHIQVEQVGEHIAVARFNRPEARNAVNAAVAADMFDFVEKVEKDPNLRVGIVTGNGPVFCAGADLKEVSAGRDIRVKRPGGFAGFTHHKRSKPWIAALNGSAYGGGAELTLSCDLVVMTKGTVIALTEVRRGLIALGGGVVRAPRALPPMIANEMLLTGEPLSAERAYELGLANRLVDAGQVLDEAIALAEKIAEASPFGVRESLRLARLSPDVSLEEMWELNDATLGALFESPDFREGPKAFVEKRKPVWST